MTCIIQEPQNRFFLTESGAWTSDINQAVEFSSVRQTIEHKQRLHLDDATVLVFRGKEVYRLLPNAVTPAVTDEEPPDLVPTEDAGHG